MISWFNLRDTEKPLSKGCRTSDAKWTSPRNVAWNIVASIYGLQDANTEAPISFSQISLQHLPWAEHCFITDHLSLNLLISLKSSHMATNFLRLLIASPEINPINQKARSIPILNPFDKYGRVFFFSWLGFFVAFLSWYSFPPLVSSIHCANLQLYAVSN
jgi:hypothetical protein